PDWTEIAALITPRTRMIVFNTPHNPTGTTLKAEDLQALSRLTSGTDILVLSDEVYEHLIYDAQAHQSVLRYPELWQRSLAVYSFGKTFHNTGWKIGYCLAPAHLMAEFRKVHQFNVFSVNTPMQHALADYLADAGTYLSLPGFYQQKRDFFLDALQGSRLRPLPCEGTYFCTFDYSAISQEPDTEFAKRMTREFGVAAIPVSVFYSDGRD
ncbi:MAG: aminotransferase class I/II-fold pyridoxal phosphate-dependent enzyme, partial [Flavobacteriales bacterium]|nr:aminotransferase class I/II-fold pyridoxal phosphate-dependent enzyme [Flavobacteriales bacterium]